MGDKEFWQDKDGNYKKQMTLVYNEQIKDLKKVVSEFKIETAVVHLDETSPHMHIVGVAISNDNKRGMKKQVAKSKVFTRENLTRIQDEMRIHCIKSFNRIYRENLELKEKQVGRNLSIPVKEMGEYKEIKRNFERKAKIVEKTNKSVELLNKRGHNIEVRLATLQKTPLNKNKYVISSEDVELVREYINTTKNTTKEITGAKKLNEFVKKVDNEYSHIQNQNLALEQQLRDTKEELEELKIKLSMKEKIIEKLEQQVETFKNLYYDLKDFWKGIIKEFQQKICYGKNENYKSVADDLVNKGILDQREKEIVNDPSRAVITIEELVKDVQSKGAR